MSALYLIRHGQAGPRDDYDRLSELGLRQARLLGEHLAALGVRFEAVFSGTLRRQRETARAALDAYRRAGGAPPEVVESPLWDEFDLDAVYRQMAVRLAAEDADFARAFEELTRRAANGDAAVHRAHHQCDIAMVRAWVEGRFPFDGESWSEFRERIHRAVESLDGTGAGRKLAVFSSATPIGVVAAKALGLDDVQLWRLAGAAYNSGVSTFRLAADDLRLFTFNGVPHLPDPELWSFR